MAASGNALRRASALIAPLGAGRNATLLSCQPSPHIRTHVIGSPFRKMSGLGNEILVVDLRGGRAIDLSPSVVQAIAKQPLSHFDQMMGPSEPRSLGYASLCAHL